VVQEKLDMRLNRDLVRRIDRYTGFETIDAGVRIRFEETNMVNIGMKKWTDDASSASVPSYLDAPDHEERRTGELLVTAVTPDVLRFTFNPDGASEVPKPVTPAATTAAVEVVENGSIVSMSTSAVTVRFSMAEARYEIVDKEGATIVGENNDEKSTYFGFLSPPAGTVRIDGRDYRCQSFTRNRDEDFYGLGERFDDFNKRGRQIEIWNVDPANTMGALSYINVPFFISTRGYGMIVNTFTRSFFDLGSKTANALSITVDGDELDYFIVTALNPKAVLHRYFELTGMPACPPMWSFGLWLSSLGEYTSAAAVLQAGAEVREKRFPVDVIHVDPPWLKGRTGLVCTYEWGDAFQDTSAFVSELHGRGLKLCLWISPYLPEGCQMFDEALDRGLLVKTDDDSVIINAGPMNWRSAPFGYIDFTNPSAVAWFKGVLADLLRQGVDVFKPDLGELGPVEARYHNGMSGVEGHNYYTLAYQRAVYEATHEVKGSETMIWCRSGFVGSHRYPVHWAGDVTCDYDNMAGQLRAILSASMSGFVFFSHDIGGFKGQPSPELFIRWFQFGMFSSHARIHGRQPREPWDLGPQAEAICRRYARLRYSLLPYIQSAAERCCTRGEPMLKPLVLEYPTDPNVRNIDDEYLFCDDILVAPMFQDEGPRSIYLPHGRWTEYESEQTYEGGVWIERHYTLHEFPLFVRANSIIVTTDPAEHVEEGASWGRLMIDVYPGEEGNERHVWCTAANPVSAETEARGHRTDRAHIRYSIRNATVRVELRGFTCETDVRLRSAQGYTLVVHAQ
jgi:alpha-D-xyloside xylohydrolase